MSILTLGESPEKLKFDILNSAVTCCFANRDHDILCMTLLALPVSWSALAVIARFSVQSNIDKMYSLQIEKPKRYTTNTIYPCQTFVFLIISSYSYIHR